VIRRIALTVVSFLVTIVLCTAFPIISAKAETKIVAPLSPLTKTSGFIPNRYITWSDGSSSWSHLATDYDAYLGQPVMAIAGGKVKDTGYREADTGYYVVLEHNINGVTVWSRYQHFSKAALVTKGDTVVAGQQIGTAGDTGNASGVHLHIQIFSGTYPTYVAYDRSQFAEYALNTEVAGPITKNGTIFYNPHRIISGTDVIGNPSSGWSTVVSESCNYKIVKDVTLRKAPFDSAEKGSYIDADDNVTVTSVAVVDNGSNYWLKLGGAYDGQYIFSGYSNTGVQNGNQYLQYVSASHGITWSDNNLSGITHTQGKSLALNGQVTSNATIKSITAQLYHSGSKWGDPYTASVNSQSYSMYGSAIDMNMKFGSLSAGNCRLDLKVEYYTNRMSTATYTIQTNFTVGSGSSAAASTLKITGVNYPATYMYNNGGYGYVVDSGTVSSNYTLTKITTDIQNSSGSSIATGLPKTVTPSGTSYSISALNSVLPFSKISSAGTYYWIITATDSSGKSVTLKMPINAVASGSNTIATGTTETTAVTGVSVDLDEVTLRAGQTTKLTATVSPSNATNKSVTWKSSNTAVATVSNGTVTAKAGGTATITCTTADGGYTASCMVTVTTSVNGISLSPTALTLEWGKTSSLTATISPTNATNKTVHWSTSNSSVATVDNGVVKGVSAGTATITAMAEDGGYKATCAVTVKVSPTGVKLNASSTTLNVGNTTTLTATVSPSNATNKNVTWSSSNTAVATVSGGKVTAVANGTATITCKTADGGYAATCTVTVKTPVSGVSLNVSSASLYKNWTKTLTATVSPSTASNKSVTWSSDNTAVATVSSSGVVTGKSNGTATITCKTVDGSYTASCKVTVSTQVNGVLLEPQVVALSPVNVRTGPSTSYEVITKLQTGDTLPYAGNKQADSDGTVWYNVTVNGKAGWMSSNLSEIQQNQTIIVDKGEHVTLQYFIEPADATNKNVTWSSSNTSVATVNAAQVAAVAPGKTTITCTTHNGGYSATCTVVVYGEKKLVLPADLKMIESEAFRQLAMDTVILSPNTESIDSKAFADCDDLSIIYIPDNVVQIAEDAFDGSDNVCFVCESENAAATYAKKHSIPYVVE